MKICPLLLAVLALTGCKYGSRMEAYEGSRKYIKDGGTSEVTYKVPELRSEQLPNRQYQVAKNNQKKAWDSDIAKCKTYRPNEKFFNRVIKEGTRPNITLAQARRFDIELQESCIKKADQKHEDASKFLPSKSYYSSFYVDVEKTKTVQNISCIHEKESRQYVCYSRDEDKKYKYFRY